MSAAGVAAAVAAAAAAGAGGAAGAGPPPAPAPSVAAAGVSAGSVFVKRSDDVRARFAPVEIFVGDAVGHLAERASLKLAWRTTAAYVDLFLVPEASEDAVASREDGAEALVLATPPLSSIKSLLAVSVRDRSCLLARLSGPPAAAPGECARARLAASFRARRAGGRGAHGTVRGIPLRSLYGAHLLPSPLLIPSPSQAAAAAAAWRSFEQAWSSSLWRRQLVLHPS